MSGARVLRVIGHGVMSDEPPLRRTYAGARFDDRIRPYRPTPLERLGRDAVEGRHPVEEADERREERDRIAVARLAREVWEAGL